VKGGGPGKDGVGTLSWRKWANMASYGLSRRSGLAEDSVWDNILHSNPCFPCVTGCSNTDSPPAHPCGCRERVGPCGAAAAGEFGNGTKIWLLGVWETAMPALVVWVSISLSQLSLLFALASHTFQAPNCSPIIEIISNPKAFLFPIYKFEGCLYKRRSLSSSYPS
jgi:hypothetical protein